MVIVDTPSEEAEGEQEWEDVSDDEWKWKSWLIRDDNREDDEGIYAGYQG
jgi:hypothetical protein